MRTPRKSSVSGPEVGQDSGQAQVNSRPSTRSTLGPAATVAPSAAGGIFKSAAVEVLRAERRLMSTGDITRVAVQRGFLKAQGKTPEASMASALYTDVKKRSGASIFTRPQEGLFGLREWIDEGFFPEGFWAGGGPSLEFAESGVAVAANAPYKRSSKSQHRITRIAADDQEVAAAVTGSGADRAVKVSDAEDGSPTPLAEPQQPGLSVGVTCAGRPPLPQSSSQRGASKQGRGRGRGGRRRSIDQGASEHDATGEPGSTQAGAGDGAGDNPTSDALFLLEAAALAGETSGAGAEFQPPHTDNDLQLATAAPAVRRPVRRRRPAALEVGDSDEERASGGEEEGIVASAAAPLIAPPGRGHAVLAGSCAGVAGSSKGSVGEHGGGKGAAENSSKEMAGPRITIAEVLSSPMPYAPGSFVEDESIRPLQPRKRKFLSVSIPDGGGGRLPDPGEEEGGDNGSAGVAEDQAAAKLLGHLSAAPSRDPLLMAPGGITDPIGILGVPLAPGVLPQACQQQCLAMARGAAAFSVLAGDAGANMDWQLQGALQLNMRQQWPAAMGYPQQGLFSPPSGLLDTSSLAPTPASGMPTWPIDAAVATSQAQSSAPTAPMAVDAGTSSATARPGAPVVLELASPRAAPGRRLTKRPRGRSSPNAGSVGAAATAEAAQPAAASGPLLSPRAVEDLARLDQWQAMIEAAEKALGRDHPAVGRAWMDLAKALQSVALHSDRARMATKRAFDIVVAAARGGLARPARESFLYLLGRGQQGQQGEEGKGQQQQTGAVCDDEIGGLPPGLTAEPQQDALPPQLNETQHVLPAGGKENSPRQGGVTVDISKPAGGGADGQQ